MNAETELLKLLIKTCQTVRNPKRDLSRVELAIPAAQWEMRFIERLNELNPKPTQTIKVAA